MKKQPNQINGEDQLQLGDEPSVKTDAKPPKTKLQQQSLFDDSAVDDWGDSALLRRTNAGMKRLL